MKRKKVRFRSSRSQVGRDMFDANLAETCQQMEQAVVRYEQALRMSEQCQTDMLKLKARMQRASQPARKIPRSDDELLRFPGFRIDAAYFSE